MGVPEIGRCCCGKNIFLVPITGFESGRAGSEDPKASVWSFRWREGCFAEAGMVAWKPVSCLGSEWSWSPPVRPAGGWSLVLEEAWCDMK